MKKIFTTNSHRITMERTQLRREDNKYTGRRERIHTKIAMDGREHYGRERERV